MMLKRGCGSLLGNQLTKGSTLTCWYQSDSHANVGFIPLQKGDAATKGTEGRLLVAQPCPCIPMVSFS